jgi:hypothetical protein
MARYSLGLDVHKVRTQYCVLDGAGPVVREGSVPTEEVLTLVDRPDLAAVLEAIGDWCAPYGTSRASGVAVDPGASRPREGDRGGAHQDGQNRRADPGASAADRSDPMSVGGGAAGDAPAAGPNASLWISVGCLVIQPPVYLQFPGPVVCRTGRCPGRRPSLSGLLAPIPQSTVSGPHNQRCRRHG